MDAEPWTYQVMAKEMLREGRLEAAPDPATPEVSDQRNYLYLELDTTRAQAGVGTTLAARVGGTWYTSHHAQNSWSIDRDGPAATTIELPAGTSAQDVEAIKAVGVPTATTPPLDWRIELKALNRGFLLGGDYLPQPSFVQWRGSLALTAAAPEVIVWTR